MNAVEVRFLAVVDGLLREGSSLLALHDRAAFLTLNDGIVAVIWPSLRGEALAERLRELLLLEARANFTLIVVGGGRDARETLQALRPRRSWRRRVERVHVSAGDATFEDAPMWCSTSRPLPAQLAAALEAEVAPDLDAQALRERLREAAPPPPRDEERRVLEEQRAFTLQLRSGRPYLTWTLLASIAAGFALELAWGGSEWPPVLVRLGANLSDTAEFEDAGVWWRYGASTFLHGGLMHVAVNSYVLYVLGSFFERVVGRARFAIIYAVAAFAGGWASATWSDSVLSVGASGAIWGLLGATAALALRPGTLIPQHLVGPMRRMALINLAINLSVSFLPRIDIMAHIGGGIAGLLVMLGLAELERIGSAPAKDGQPRRFHAMWTAGRRAKAVLAVGLVALLYASWGIALERGRAWALSAPEAVQTHRVADLEVRVPALLGEPTIVTAGEGETVYRWGDLLVDPFAAAIVVTPLSAIPPEARDEVKAEFSQLELPLPEGASRVHERRVVESPWPTFEETFVYENGLRSMQRYQLRFPADEGPARRIIVDVAHWPDAPESWTRAANDLLDSVTRPPNAP